MFDPSRDPKNTIKLIIIYIKKKKKNIKQTNFNVFTLLVK